MTRICLYFGALFLAVSLALFQPVRLAAQDLNGPEAVTARSSEPREIASLIPDVSTPLPNATHAEPEFAYVPPVKPIVAAAKESTHAFWDRQNRILFATAASFAAADFCVTRANLASGGRELNPVTRVLSGSTPGLAANFVLETGSLIGVSYIFHKTGHHKLERIASFVNIGSSAGAVAYGLSHR